MPAPRARALALFLNDLLLVFRTSLSTLDHHSAFLSEFTPRSLLRWLLCIRRAKVY